MKLEDQAITIQVLLDPPPIQRTSFGKPLYLCTSLSAVEAFADGVVREYTSASDVDDDTDLTATVKADLKKALGQQPRCTSILVARATIDDDGVGGPMDFSPALGEQLATIAGVNSDWYKVVLETRGVAEAQVQGENGVPSAIVQVDAMNKWLVYQTTDKTYAAAATIGGRGIAIYSQLPTAADLTTFNPVGLCAAVNRMAFDLDSLSPPWTGALSGVEVADVTAAEFAALKAANVNCVVPYGAAPTFLYPGFAGDGRPIYAGVTADWLTARLREDFAAHAVKLANRGEKWPMNAIGQAAGAAIIDARINIGLSGRSPHFNAAQKTKSLPITADDRTNFRLRWSGMVQTGDNAINFSVEAVQTSDPLPEQE